MSFVTRIRKQAAIVACSLLALTGLGASIAYAAIPSADGTIHACYAKTGNATTYKGEVRIVDAGEACKANEAAISWNRNQPPPGSTLPRSLYRTGSSVDAGFVTTVLSLDMPVGTWVINFKAETANFGAYCRLTLSAGGFGVTGGDTASAQGTNTGDVVPFTLTTRATFTQPGTATVDCSTNSSVSTQYAIITDPAMTAVEVAAPPAG